MFKNKNVTASRTMPNQFSRSLFAPLPSRYNVLAALLSLGQDRRWRSAMLDHVVGSEPKLVLDVACGPCAVTKALTKKTSAHVIGLDLSNEMLREGQANMNASGLSDRVSL